MMNLNEGKMPSHEVHETSIKYFNGIKVGLLVSLKYHQLDNSLRLIVLLVFFIGSRPKEDDKRNEISKRGRDIHNHGNELNITFHHRT